MTTILHGIDVSSYQGAIDWPRVKASGTVDFAIAKRSEGTGWSDPTFDANWSGIKAVGLGRGLYHFVHPESNNPIHEANYLVSLLPELEMGDIVAPDIETGRGQDRSAWLLAFCEAVERDIGYAPIIYCDQDYATNWLRDPALARYPLWIAAYQPSIPPSIGVWTRGASIWQHSSQGTVPGIVGPVDLNQTSRTLEELKALGKPAPPIAVRGKVSRRVALKPQPAHGGRNLAVIPAGGQIIDEGARQNGFGAVQWRDLHGWVPAEVIAPLQRT